MSQKNGAHVFWIYDKQDTNVSCDEVESHIFWLCLRMVGFQSFERSLYTVREMGSV